MTIEQCARELANLLKSGQLPPPHQVSALINSCLRGVGARQMDLKRHQLAVAFKEMVPDSEATRNYFAENTAPRSLMPAGDTGGGDKQDFETGPGSGAPPIPRSPTHFRRGAVVRPHSDFRAHWILLTPHPTINQTRGGRQSQSRLPRELKPQCLRQTRGGSVARSDDRRDHCGEKHEDDDHDHAKIHRSSPSLWLSR